MGRWCCAGVILTLATGVLLADAEPRSDVATLLQTIKKVGREGAGNPEAARAWKALVNQGPSALLPVLSAFDEDNLTVSNWLRPAVDAIAEKAQADGKLSKELLATFLADLKKPSSARRVAYEWLVKLDPTAADRLLPTMLKDPSAELRREAVERLVKEGEAAKMKKDTSTAKAAYQKALTGACDPDQVEAIAKALDEMGVKTDLAKHHGFVRTWWLITPFDHRKGTGWDVAYPPEKGIDLHATYKGAEDKPARWVEHTSADPMGIVDLNKALGNLKGTIAYAYAVVDSPEEREVELRIGCINGLKVFVNDRQVFGLEEYHHGMRVDQYTARAMLKKGKNTLLLKVCQNEQKEKWAQEWRFQCRITDRVGARVPFEEIKQKGPAAREEK
ncbi:MAG: hypothetical protein U0840_17680 [Gemmataceae bacterium]